MKNAIIVLPPKFGPLPKTRLCYNTIAVKVIPVSESTLRRDLKSGKISLHWQGRWNAMKTILALLILFCVIALPALGELTAQDLEKIRQIVKESETALTARIEKVDSKVGAIETRLRTVETGIAELRGRSIGFGVLRDWHVTICAIGAFIISIFALVKAQPKAPQTRQDTPKTVSQ